MLSIEANFTNGCGENEMILIVRAKTLPSEAMSLDEVTLTGKVLIASSITDNGEMIEKQLIDMNMIDDFDNAQSAKIVDLAIDILSHHNCSEKSKTIDKES